MKNAVHGYVLGNGVMVSAKDIIQIITIDDEVGVGTITDITEDGITIDLLTEACEMDVFFKDVKEITKIKNNEEC